MKLFFDRLLGARLQAHRLIGTQVSHPSAVDGYVLHGRHSRRGFRARFPPRPPGGAPPPELASSTDSCTLLCTTYTVRAVYLGSTRSAFCVLCPPGCHSACTNTVRYGRRERRSLANRLGFLFGRRSSSSFDVSLRGIAESQIFRG